MNRSASVKTLTGKTLREVIVEDVKGYKTDIYRMKKKMMANVYGIEVQEVKAK